MAKSNSLWIIPAARFPALAIISLWPLLLVLTATAATPATSPEPRALVEAAMEHWRGRNSYSEMTMTIHRPSWQRTLSMRSWTEGQKQSLVRITAPKKDRGNGTLIKDKALWTFAPKLNRIIKIPSSMMSQGWMGSDFSSRDISKGTDILDSYQHRLSATDSRDGHTIYTVTATPFEDAAVVWGKEVLVIRDDYLLLEQQFWDQDGRLVKTMKATEIRELQGRPVATVLHMEKVDSGGQWTEMRVDSIDFEISLPSNLFTLSNLRNPRE